MKKESMGAYVGGAYNSVHDVRRDEPKDKYVENVMARARLTLVTRKDGTQYIRLK